MVCDCCGRKKKLFESFAGVSYKQAQMNFCADCNNLAYKVRDHANNQNNNEYEKHIKEWKKRAKKPSDLFLAWQKEFLAPLEKVLKKEDTFNLRNPKKQNNF